ncbi:zinc-binding dehydrogenase [Mycolicibacter algericus]|uniref:Alcohol dehydrogenase n=1 Tax=Mycolicibacter algericus TaxID=1288388 RepID=A0A7I9YD00_MYCAL|nr:zinc-binding dehydrogenase [Mycolicibacter algericus]GFG86484.1 alcohol dehydrogenase [Mycolicibacter algericus]
MRAVVLNEGGLTVRETADPVPGEGHLLLRTLSCAICASDIHFMDHPETDGDDPLFAGYDRHADIVMGHEFVGEVIGHGPNTDAEQFPLGSRVTSIPFLFAQGGGYIIGQHQDAPGGFGEQMLVSQVMARTVPDDVSDDAVALVDAFAVGEGYVRLSGIRDGDVPVVVGAGAIGLSAVAALSRRGISPIIVADFNADRRRLAEQFGAHIVVDPVAESPYAVWRKNAPNGGADATCFIYECVGGPGIVNRIVAECPHGSFVSCAGGHYTQDAVGIATATRKGIRLQFGGAPEAPDWYGVLDAVCRKEFDPTPCIGMTIGLDNVAEALELARTAQGPPRIMVHPGRSRG